MLEVVYIVRIASAIADKHRIRLSALASTSGRLDEGCRCILAALRTRGGLPRQGVRIFLVLRDNLTFEIKGDEVGLKLPASEIELAELLLSGKIGRKAFRIGGLSELVSDLKEEGFKVYLMEEGGEYILHALNELLKAEKLAFVLGGPYGIPPEEEQSLKRLGVKTLSLGSKSYFASYCIIILNYLLSGDQSC